MRAPSVWGIAGSPIDHSITPALFKTVGETLGMASIETIALDVENAEELLRYLSEREGDKTRTTRRHQAGFGDGSVGMDGG